MRERREKTISLFMQLFRFCRCQIPLVLCLSHVLFNRRLDTAIQELTQKALPNLEFDLVDGFEQAASSTKSRTTSRKG